MGSGLKIGVSSVSSEYSKSTEEFERKKWLQKHGGGTKWLEEIHPNPKFYLYNTDPMFGIIQLGIFDRKGGRGKCRSREKMGNTGKTCNFSPRANFLIKHRKSRNAFLILS